MQRLGFQKAIGTLRWDWRGVTPPTAPEIFLGPLQKSSSQAPSREWVNRRRRFHTRVHTLGLTRVWIAHRLISEVGGWGLRRWDADVGMRLRRPPLRSLCEGHGASEASLVSQFSR